MSIFKIPFFGKRFLSFVTKTEGGVIKSKTLRKYLSKQCKIDLGLYSYIGNPFSFNHGGKHVYIGRYCSIAHDARYLGTDHKINSASTSAIFYRKDLFGYETKDVEREELFIGNDVWIGSGVFITKNCHSIGDGAVVGAGSIVTKDVPPYTIVVGSPAKQLRMRFEESTICCLQKSKWWELAPEELMKFYDVFDSPLLFANRIYEYKTNKEK